MKSIHKDEEAISPGNQLKTILMELFKPDPIDTMSIQGRLDLQLREEGELTSLVYDSLINYTLRRLIFTAEFKCRAYNNHGQSKESFLKVLDDFVADYLNIRNKILISKIAGLLNECLMARKGSVSDGIRNQLRKKAKERSRTNCYICGQEIDSTIKRNSSTQDNPKEHIPNKNEYVGYSEIEHVWPRALGGSSKEFNLNLSCQICNNTKKDYINASDFHFEEICIVSDENDDSFNTAMRRDFKVAIWAKNSYNCVSCQKPASSMGELMLSRVDENDSWHFLNIEAYCSSCFYRYHRSKQ